LNLLHVSLIATVQPLATMASGDAIRNVPIILYSPASLRRHQLPPVSCVCRWREDLFSSGIDVFVRSIRRSRGSFTLRNAARLR